MDEPADDGPMHLLASTADPVDWGGWREILVHGSESIDSSAATALLINHDPNQIAGRISNARVDKDGLHLDAEQLPGAKLQTGVSVADAVKSGALRGVSIGYQYSRNDVDWNEKTRTATVKRWRLLEASLTPIPADGKAGVRQVPFGLDDSNPAAPAAIKEDRAMSDDNKPEPQGNDAETANLKRELELAKTENRVRALAVKHGVEADGIDFAKGEAACLETLLERKAAKEQSKPADKVAPVTVTRDAGDKFIEAAVKGIRGEAGGIHMSALELARRCARIDGRDSDQWNDLDVASYAIRSTGYSRNANKLVGSFSVLLGNTANKQVLDGFNRYTPVWSQFCRIKDAANFNSHNHVGVGNGRLVETAEGVAFPELTQKEGSFSSQVVMWGATISISEQAIINDELGELADRMVAAGYAAARTIERQVFYKLLNATWTNDVTTSAALGTTGKLDTVRADLKKKLSPAGEKMENDGAILLVDPTNRYNAEAATGQLYGVGTGANSQTGSNAVRAVRVVDSTFIGDTALLGGALTTDYYLLCDPMVAPAVIVEFLRGMRTPMISEFDPGANAAVNYKIQLPFQATVPTHTDSAGNARVTGAQKATVA